MRYLTIDCETADNITRLTLTDAIDTCQSELDQWQANPKDEDNPNGYWLHPEDVVNNMKHIRQINSILQYFGGELYGEQKTRQFNPSTSMVEASAGLEAYFLEIRKTSTEA